MRERVLQSAVWLAGTRVIGQGVTFVTTMMLAPLLSTEDFGLMAMAAVYMGMLDTFIDCGFLNAIIQAKTISSRQLSSCFWLLSAISLVVFGGTLWASPQVALLFEDTRLTPLIRALAFSLLFVPTQIIVKGTLTRDLKLDVLSRLEMYSGLIRAAVSIVLAYSGAAVWSLVGGFIVEKILLSVALPVVAKWSPTMAFDLSGVKSLLLFGVNVSLANMLWFLYYRADVFIIGRLLGASALGIYTIAMQFSMAIIQFGSLTWNRLIYPVFVKHQQSPTLKEVFLNASAAIFIVSAPLFAGLAAIAPDLVFGFLGARWAAAIVPMQLLSVVGAMKILSNVMPSALNAIGSPSLNVKMNMVSAVLFTLLFYCGAKWRGLDGVLIAWFIAYPIRYYLYLAVTSSRLHFTFFEYLKSHVGTLLVSLAMFAAVATIRSLMIDWNVHSRLSLSLLVGILFYTGAQCLLNKKQVFTMISYTRTS